jgi:hypothetical protein
MEDARFEIVAAVFCDMTPCSLAGVSVTKENAVCIFMVEK